MLLAKGGKERGRGGEGGEGGRGEEGGRGGGTMDQGEGDGPAPATACACQKRRLRAPPKPVWTRRPGIHVNFSCELPGPAPVRDGG